MLGIFLSNCKGVALVDFDKYDDLVARNWWLNKGYAQCIKDGKNVCMHHLVIGKPVTDYFGREEAKDLLENVPERKLFTQKPDNTDWGERFT